MFGLVKFLTKTTFKRVLHDFVQQNWLRKEFKITLDELDWMDDITTKKAHVNVDKMTPHMILDNNLIYELYMKVFS